MAELILALDLPSESEALSLFDLGLQPAWVKLGSALFTRTGPRLIDELRRRGYRVFLDLKWHDIPNTVRSAVSRARDLGVELVTVHALGGRAMLAAAKEAAGPGMAVVGVTVLTSHDSGAFAEVMGRPIPDLGGEVERLALLAKAAGLDGVVSSPLEVAALRSVMGPAALLVTPGIRSASGAKGDQARTSSVQAAVRAGATHLVVGRPVLEAADPSAAWRALVEEVNSCS